MSNAAATRPSRELIGGFDILKFVLSLMIVDMHAHDEAMSEPVDDLFYTGFTSHGLEVAVPCFFMMSAFFLFSKMRSGGGLRAELRLLGRYEWRVARLYLFWIVVLGYYIFTVWHKEYCDLSPLSANLFVRHFFLGSEFGASWFFGALIVGVPVVYALVKLLGGKLAWVIPAAAYLLLFFDPLHEVIYGWYYAHFHYDADLSFLYGLVWIAAGWYLSGGRLRRLSARAPWWSLVAVVAVSLALACAFPRLSHVFRVPMAVALMALAYGLRAVSPALCLRLRAYSIHIFCLHYTVIALLEGVSWIPQGEWVPLAAGSLAVSLCVSEVIIRLSRVRWLGWLRYSM